MFRHPSRYALSQAEFKTADDFLVGVFGRPQDQLVTLQHVNETRIALYQRYGEVNHPA
jgi:hypothetical protein